MLLFLFFNSISGLLKNICFDSNRHSWLLMNEDVDVLSYILLPLAGPEEYTAEENDMFPTDLQVREIYTFYFECGQFSDG